MKRVFVILVTLLSLTTLFTCAVSNTDNKTVPGNNAPSAILSAYLSVTGAGVAAVNGDYLFASTNTDGSPIYTNTNACVIYRTPDYSCDIWYIGDDTNNNYRLYKMQGLKGNTLPNSKWGMTCNSSGSTPVSFYRDAIKGYAYVGQVLIAPAYTYYDAEGDSEGAPVYAWYRCNDTNDPGTIIAGETSTNYTLTSSDDGKYICFSVTPTATSGTTTGAPSRSRYFGPVQTMPTGYIVAGAGDSAFNGVYAFNGFFNGLPSYKHQTGSYYLFFAGCSQGYWYLRNSYTSYETAYRCETSTNTLYFTNYTWATKCDGTSPAPTVQITNL